MKFKYHGKGMSLNQAYSGKWQARQRMHHQLKTELIGLVNGIAHVDTFYDVFEIKLRYYGNFDIDNTVATVKIFVDVLRQLGVVSNDDKKHFKKLTIILDPELPKFTYEFEIRNYKPWPNQIFK